MAGKPIVTIGSMHVCPMCSGTVPHVGGPVTGPGMAGATINGQPVAVMGDMCTCVGPPDVIAQGCPGATINGVPIATVGCMTAHGGQIVQGAPGATIGSTMPTPNATMPVGEIPFPEITLSDRIGAGITGNSAKLKEAEQNIKKLKEEATSNPQEVSDEYSISSSFGLNQAQKLADELSEANFMAVMMKTFGTDIPLDAYTQLYKDLSDRKVNNVNIEVHKQPIHGHLIAYNSRRQVICLTESMLKGAIDDNEKRPELLSALTEEFGHHIDYLLRQQYSSVGGDARLDEGAVFAFQVFDINLLEQSSVPIGEVTSPDFNGTLELDLSTEHVDFKQFVNEQAQKDDGKSPDGNYEFFNAGRLDHGYGHENIDKELKDIGYSRIKDLPHIYLGNWLRDYSQLVCGSTIRMSEEAQLQLKKQTKNQQEFARILELHSGKLSREGMTNIVGLLAAKEFVYEQQKQIWNEYNANECMDEFHKRFNKITPEVLGCYKPEEHIDNPKGLTDESYIDSDFFVGCTPEQLKLNLKTGQKRYIKESFGEKRPSPTKYITDKLLSAVKKGRTPNGLIEMGAALHVLQDYFAHTNFVELCLVKLVNTKVYTWVEQIDISGIRPHALAGKALVNPKNKVVAKPYKSTQQSINALASCIPVVSGVFGHFDTFATLCSKLRHMFELPNFKYVPTEPGQRSFADLAIVATLTDMANGQSKDASKNNGNYKGADYAAWLKRYNYFLALRDKKAQIIKEGGALGTSLKYLDITGNALATIITFPHALAINVLLHALEASVKEAETYARNYGTDPTHTQLNKDDPAHPINDLAGKLGVMATQRVGNQMIKIWRGLEKPSTLHAIIDDIMSHPCQTNWMDQAVLRWAAKNPDKVRKLEKSSYIEIFNEQKEKLEKTIESEKKKRDLAFNQIITHYEEQYA